MLWKGPINLYRYKDEEWFLSGAEFGKILSYFLIANVKEIPENENNRFLEKEAISIGEIPLPAKPCVHSPVSEYLFDISKLTTDNRPKRGYNTNIMI